MNGPTLHILNKDLRASWLPLLILWFGIFLTDTLLTFPRLGPYVFFPQCVCWVYAAYIFWQRLREDDTRNCHTAWWVTRPVRAETIVKAKELYTIFFLIVPAVLSRVILCRFAGYGWVDGVSTAWLGSIPFIIIAFALLARTLHFHAFKGHLKVWITALVGPPLILMITVALFSLGTLKAPKLHRHNTVSPTPAEVGKMPDPDYIFNFPDDVVLKGSSLQGQFFVDNQTYRLTSHISNHRFAERTLVNSSVWFWYLRSLPEHADLRAGKSVVNLPQKTQIKKIISEKRWNKHEVDIPENGGVLLGKKSEIAVVTRWDAVRIRQFWEGKLHMGEKTAKDGFIFSLREGGKGKITFRIQTAVTHGIWPGSPALHAFDSGAAVVFSSQEGDHDVLLPGPCRHLQYGWPGISQVYEFDLPDPRSFLTDTNHFKVTVYSASRAYAGSKDQRLNFNWEFPRMKRLKALLAADMILPDISAPRRVNELNPSDKREKPDLYDNPELAKKIKDLFRRSSGIEELWDRWYRDLQHKNFDPARETDISTVMGLLEKAPRLYRWLPTEQQEEARKKLEGYLRKRPVMSPYGMLAVAQEAGLASEEHADDLAWCFIHSYRQFLVKGSRGLLYGLPRCDSSLLQVVPESTRDRAWNKTWDRFRVEAALDYRAISSIREKKEYLMEAIRRKSPQAYATTTICLRQMWARQYRLRTQPSQDEILTDMLKGTKDWIPFLQDYCDGPKDPKAFLQWFLLNGFLLDK